MLWDTLILGTRTLMLSADIAAQEPEPQPSDKPDGEQSSIFSDPMAWGTMAVSLGDYEDQTDSLQADDRDHHDERHHQKIEP